jgi:hypothetical protein
MNLSNPIFSAEERVVVAGKDFDGFLVCPSFREFVARAHDGNLAFLAALTESVAAHIVVDSDVVLLEESKP